MTESVARSEGLNLDGHPVLYVQTMEQKLLAIQSGLGIGHVPRHRIEHQLARGELIELNIVPTRPEQFMAWELTNRGKGLAALVAMLSAVDW